MIARGSNMRGLRVIRQALFDSNGWKTFIHARLAVAMGDADGLSHLGRHPDRHRLLAEHLTAEYRLKTEGRGGVVDECQLGPEAVGNRWLDGDDGCAVEGSILGVILPGTDAWPTSDARRAKLSELQPGRSS